MKVKDMNKEQRPREHALQDGIEEFPKQKDIKE